MDGAVRSGERASDEVAKLLGATPKPPKVKKPKKKKRKRRRHSSSGQRDPSFTG
jgi:hypothetical protein